MMNLLRMRACAVSGIKPSVRRDVVHWGAPSGAAQSATLFEGRLPMKIEKYLLLLLAAFVLLVLGTFLHKIAH